MQGEKRQSLVFAALPSLARSLRIHYITMASVNMTNPDANNGDVKLITSLLGRHQGELQRVRGRQVIPLTLFTEPTDFPVKDILFLDIFPIRELVSCFAKAYSNRCGAAEMTACDALIYAEALRSS